MASNALIPNSFQHPNAYIDWLSYYLTGEEEKVLNKAVREIIGWHNKIESRQARIALSVFVNGKTINGEHVCLGCGLSTDAVRSALESLDNFNILIKVGKPTNDGQLYELVEDWDGLNWNAIKARRESWDDANRSRTEKARARLGEKRKNGGAKSQNGGTVGQYPGLLSDNTPSLLSDSNKETHETQIENKPASSGPPSPPAGEEKEAVEPTPLLTEEDYTLEVYYKDADRVKAKGRVKEGPWSVKCDCGNTVQIDRFNAPADCSCGMHEIVLVERKPGGAVKKKSAAVDLYYRIAAAQVRYGSMEEWEADISATVSDLDRWRAVVKTAVSSRSINPRNIANLLNCYRDDRLPGQKKGGAVDSRPSKFKRIIKQKDGTEREVEFVRMPQNGGNTR